MLNQNKAGSTFLQDSGCTFAGMQANPRVLLGNPSSIQYQWAALTQHKYGNTRTHIVDGHPLYSIKDQLLLSPSQVGAHSYPTWMKSNLIALFIIFWVKFKYIKNIIWCKYKIDILNLRSDTYLFFK